MSSASFTAQQRANRRRSAVLVTLFLLFFAWIGLGADYILYLQSQESAGNYRHRVPLAALGFTGLGVAVALAGWRRGPRQVLWSSGAWELVAPRNEKEAQLVNVVEEMAVAGGLPRPRIWIVPDRDPNAFATGVEPKESHVAVTEGLLDLLDRDELQGVVAHEMAHIRNYDVRLMTLLAALIGVMALVSDGAGRMLRVSGGRSRGGKKGGNPLLAIVLVVWLISVLLAPLISRLLALGVSRKREYLADATAAQLTRNPAALAAALSRIEGAAEPTRAIHRGSAHLCIADPTGRKVNLKSGFVADVFATHPPMSVRIARLKRMAYLKEQTGVVPEEV